MSAPVEASCRHDSQDDAMKLTRTNPLSAATVGLTAAEWPTGQRALPQPELSPRGATADRLGACAR